jgi:hypothetical protein
MPYGYGWGFGFRGASSPWPYVGWGRGGLPRCWYPWMVMSPPYAPVSPYPLLTKEEEADWLKREAEAIKAELNEVEAKIRDLETSK